MGGAALGGMYEDVSESQAAGAVERALELGVSLFDTAPLYGHGKSERFLGKALSRAPRDSFVLSTKVGRVLEPTSSAPTHPTFRNLPNLEPVFDFSRDGVLRSLDESMERLGLDRVDVVLVHDPDEGESVNTADFGEPAHYAQVLDETFPALAELRSQGVVRAVGVGMNQWQALTRFATDADFDCFLLAGRYTLLDQSALGVLLPLCVQRRISVVLGSPYASGILASDLSADAPYLYAAAPPSVVAQARRIKAACDRHGVPLKAAALQFGLGHPAVSATIPGARSTAEVEDNDEMARVSVPAQLWDELRAERLLDPEAPSPA